MPVGRLILGPARPQLLERLDGVVRAAEGELGARPADEVERVLKQSGTCWVNFGDTYANTTKGRHRSNTPGNYDSLTKRATFPKLKTIPSISPKSLCLIPARFAVRMIERGWILRNEIIWYKPNAMPQSVPDANGLYAVAVPGKTLYV